MTKSLTKLLFLSTSSLVVMYGWGNEALASSKIFLENGVSKKTELKQVLKQKPATFSIIGHKLFGMYERSEKLAKYKENYVLSGTEINSKFDQVYTLSLKNNRQNELELSEENKKIQSKINTPLLHWMLNK